MSQTWPCFTERLCRQHTTPIVHTHTLLWLHERFPYEPVSYLQCLPDELQECQHLELAYPAREFPVYLPLPPLRDEESDESDLDALPDLPEPVDHPYSATLQAWLDQIAVPDTPSEEEDEAPAAADSDSDDTVIIIPESDSEDERDSHLQGA